MTHQIDEAHQDGPLGADPAGEPAEEQRTAEGDELHHEDGRDQDRLAVAELLGAVDRRGRDDGLDPVVEEQVGDQERQRHRVLAHVAQGGDELAEAAADRVALDLLDGHRRVVVEPEEGDEGEPGPPHGGRQHAEAGGERLVEPEGLVAEVDGQVEHEQEAAAEVAERPAARGDPVAVVLVGDERQDRVVDHAGRAEEQVAQHDADGGELPVVAGGEEDAARRRTSRSRPGSPAAASCSPRGRRTPPAAAGPARTGSWRP